MSIAIVVVDTVVPRTKSEREVDDDVIVLIPDRFVFVVDHFPKPDSKLSVKSTSPLAASDRCAGTSTASAASQPQSADTRSSRPGSRPRRKPTGPTRLRDPVGRMDIGALAVARGRARISPASSTSGRGDLMRADPGAGPGAGRAGGRVGA